MAVLSDVLHSSTGIFREALERSKVGAVRNTMYHFPRGIRVETKGLLRYRHSYTVTVEIRLD